jgi:hypothetical protein
MEQNIIVTAEAIPDGTYKTIYLIGRAAMITVPYLTDQCTVPVML